MNKAAQKYFKLSHFALIVSVCFITSCDIQKRHYVKGFYFGKKEAPVSSNCRLSSATHKLSGQSDAIIIASNDGKLFNTSSKKQVHSPSGTEAKDSEQLVSATCNANDSYVTVTRVESTKVNRFGKGVVDMDLPNQMSLAANKTSGDQLRVRNENQKPEVANENPKTKLWLAAMSLASITISYTLFGVATVYFSGLVIGIGAVFLLAAIVLCVASLIRYARSSSKKRKLDGMANTNTGGCAFIFVLSGRRIWALVESRVKNRESIVKNRESRIESQDAITMG